ncbi:type I restriction endonuclease subunit R [Coleofasciculus sp. G2-EDA-02]|uniref:type I restriction endonuclease subunit R n=1 Tax=Coleofasciculus sp. G2-EDA-02 TaxID=3069529 RepID=UPI0032F8EBB7
MAKLSPEYNYCEQPTIRQLTSIGWNHINANPWAEQPEERDNYHEVLLLNRLRQKLRDINLNPNNQPWLDERRINQAIAQLQRLDPGKLIEKNETATNRLLNGVYVDGLNNKRVKINLIDFDHPHRNNFLIISQFRVNPPGVNGAKGSLRPDLVLFVNGIPLVVIECKDAGSDKLNQGINDLLFYSNQRNSDIPEGIETLFHYNQLMISCTPGRAKVGTVGSQPKHYLEWRDTSPFDPETIATSLGILQLTNPEGDRNLEQIQEDSKTKAGLNRRQQLIAGMLHPENLLDILRHYTLFTTKHNRRLKIVPRYQQFRAVYKAIHRLQQGQPTASPDTPNPRGGIIWHYQGSGKNLDMVFILRKIRTIPQLQSFKVVIITDRTDLQQQLSETATLSGQTLQIAQSINDLAKKLRATKPGIIFGMVQKFNEIGGSIEDKKLLEQFEKNPAYIEEEYALNRSDKILLLIDEAHRSHSKALHTYLCAALPKAAKIGFTGTPIISKKKKRTTEIFGSYIDTYSIRESQKDGVTVPIFYEGLEAMGAVGGADTLDQLFEVIFRDYTPEERNQIKAKYATSKEVLKAKELMQSKARHILRHYITRIMPHQFKAQVAASDRESCVLYQQYLSEAKAELVKELQEKALILQSLADADLETLDETLRFQVAAYPHLSAIQRLEFAAIISADSKNDPSTWKPWTDETNQTTYIENFSKPLAEDGMAFLIVNNKLLVGFDAPLEQVLYVDRSLKEHDLLQAIARTNRTAEGKNYGLIVDYYGIDIAEAMQVYDTEDVEGAWFDIQEELPKLDEAHQRVINFWRNHNKDIYGEEEDCINLLYDERLRAEFYHLLRDFLQEMDTFLPRPQALRYLKDAKQLGRLKKLVDDIFRDERPEDAKEKVRTLIDQHIQAQGIDLKVPPIDILSLDFEQRVQQRHSPQTRAAEMEHAIRYHIRTHFNDDPVYYHQLSEKLDNILQQHGENWEIIAAEFIRLAQNVRADETETSDNQPSAKIRPFYNTLIDTLDSPSEEIKTQIQTLATELVEFINQQTQIVGFWNDLALREELRKRIWLKLEDKLLFADEEVDRLADDITQLAERHA